MVLGSLGLRSPWSSGHGVHGTMHFWQGLDGLMGALLDPYLYDKRDTNVRLGSSKERILLGCKLLPSLPEVLTWCKWRQSPFHARRSSCWEIPTVRSTGRVLAHLGPNPITVRFGGVFCQGQKAQRDQQQDLSRSPLQRRGKWGCRATVAWNQATPPLRRLSAANEKPQPGYPCDGASLPI